MALVETHKVGQDVTVFSLDGTDLLGTLREGEIEIENSNDDGSGVADPFEYAVRTKCNWSFKGKLFVNPRASAVADAVTAPSVVFACNTGGAAYAGNGLLANASHAFKSNDIQGQDVTIKGRGPITVTLP